MLADALARPPLPRLARVVVSLPEGIEQDFFRLMLETESV